MQAKEKIQKTRNPFKKAYTAVKTEKFLKSVQNVSFKKFKKEAAQNTSVICKGYYNEAKEVAERLVPILSRELEKESNIEKSRENKEASYRYLSRIRDACLNLIHVVEINKRTANPEEEIEALEKLRIEFKNASGFLDPHQISFLSNKKVKVYMTTQTRILSESITRIKSGLKKEQGEYDRR